VRNLNTGDLHEGWSSDLIAATGLEEMKMARMGNNQRRMRRILTSNQTITARLVMRLVRVLAYLLFMGDEMQIPLAFTTYRMCE